MTDLTDDFGGTTGVDVATRAGWSQRGENYGFYVSSNNAVYASSAPAGGGRGGVGFDAGSADQFSEATLLRLSCGHSGPGVRLIDSANAVHLRCLGGGASGLTLIKRVANTTTVLHSMQGVVNSVYRLEVAANGSSSDYELFEDGASQWTGSILHTEIDGTNQYPGLYNSGTNNSDTDDWDDYDGGALGAGALTIDLSPIDSTNAFDISSVLHPEVIELTAIDSVSGFDISSILSEQLVQAPLITSINGFDVAGIAVEQLIQLGPIASINDIPMHTVVHPEIIELVAIDSTNTFGTIVIIGGLDVPGGKGGALVIGNIRLASIQQNIKVTLQ